MNGFIDPGRPLRAALLALLPALLLAVPALASAQSSAQAPEPSDAAAADSSSQRVEESDEAYRRRMELEDARQRDPLQSPAVDLPPAAQEKIDKLPQASQENIRNQVIDVIVQNDEWEPFDALREYPYTPTEAARGDPDLLDREQAAWDEQIEKYHQREAAAHAARRGPAAGPGNPGGPEGGAEGDGEGRQAAASPSGQDAGQGSGSAGDQGGAGQQGGGASGTYQPYEPNRQAAEESVSTAGVQQSALDFIRGRQGSPPTAAQATANPEANPEASAAQAPASAPAVTEQAAEASESATEEDELRGLVAIEDLDKLEDAAADEPPPEPQPEEDPDQP